MLTQLLLSQVRLRIIEESIPRLKKCLSILDEHETWRRPNENLVSVGNLVLHLCGNVRQWVIAGLGGFDDERDRDWEFDEMGPISEADLCEMLDKLAVDLEGVLEKLGEDDLLRPVSIQGFDETGAGVLVHIVEHFSYHTGQVTWHTKLIKNIDTGYYSDLDLNITS